MREFLTALLATRRVTPPDKTIPGWLARALATVDGDDVARAWARLPIRR